MADSRLEADLATRILQEHGITAQVLVRGEQDFAVYVAPEHLEQAARTLEPQ